MIALFAFLFLRVFRYDAWFSFNRRYVAVVIVGDAGNQVTVAFCVCKGR